MSDPAAVMDLPRRDAGDKLRGRTKYTIDRVRPDTLHAALLRAEVPAGRILRLDVSVALAMPGVRAIATGRDAPGLYGIGIADHPLLAVDAIRYHGEPIAAVAAETQAQARAAVKAIVLEVEPLAPVLTMAERSSPRAPRARGLARLRRPRGGRRARRQRRLGGADRARRRRSRLRAGRRERDREPLHVGRQSHVPFEPRVAIGAWEDGRAISRPRRRCPGRCAASPAARSASPRPGARDRAPGRRRLRAEVRRDDRADHRASRPDERRSVVLENSRQEEMATCLCRENAEIVIRSAVTRQGEIAGREAVVLMDCGAYGGEQVFLTTMTAHTLGGNYRVGAMRLASRAVYTNTPPNGAFRACNGVYNTFALERHTDEICEALGLDPLAFRRRTSSATATSAPPPALRGRRAGPDDRPDGSAAGQDRHDGGASDGRLYGMASVVGTWFVFTGPSPPRCISTPTAARCSSPPGSRSGPAPWCRPCRRSWRANSASIRPPSSCARPTRTPPASMSASAAGAPRSRSGPPASRPAPRCARSF